jgi:heme/copper-type cytochrome/quinol oxidase subunit 2
LFQKAADAGHKDAKKQLEWFGAAASTDTIGVGNRGSWVVEAIAAIYAAVQIAVLILVVRARRRAEGEPDEANDRYQKWVRIYWLLVFIPLFGVALGWMWIYAGFSIL